MSFIINKPEITSISSIPIFNSSSIEGIPIDPESSYPVNGQSLVYDSVSGQWTLVDISSIVGSTGPTGSSEITGGGVQTISFSDDDFSSTRTSFMISSLENSIITDQNLKCYGKTTGLSNCKTSYSFGVNEQNTKWISVGESYTGANSSIAYSIDGVSWNNLTNSTGVLSTGNDLDWDGNAWVAVGTPGTITNSSIVFSRNGLDWQSATGAVDIFNYEVRSVKTDGDRWVAVGSTGATNNICYSDDGIVWKPCTYTTGNLDPYSIGYNGCFWLVGGESVSYTTNQTIIKYSYDGVNWTDNSVTFGQLYGGVTRRVTSMCWNGGKWLFGAYFNVDFEAYGSVIYTISNGLNPVFSLLTPLVDGSSYEIVITDIKWNGKLFIASGYNPFNALFLPGVAVYLYSYDGLNWLYATAGVENSSAGSIFGNILSTEWDGTKWIGIGSQGLGGDLFGGGLNTTGYSYNGIDWIGVESAPVIPPIIADPTRFRDPIFTRGYSVRRNTQYPNKVKFPSNQTLILSNNSTPSYIGNGALTGNSVSDVSSWYSLSGITGNNACWNGDKWILVRTSNIDTNTIYYSYDGYSWTGLGNKIFSTKGNDCIWDGTKWIAVGSGTNTIAYSYDGFVWIPSPNSNSIFTECKKIYFNGSRYVSVGTGSYTIAYSTDGISWSGVSSSLFTTGNNVKYNGCIWIAVGSGVNTITYSNNGIDWIGIGNSIFSTAGNSVEWNGKLWTAGGQGTNSIAYSYNGIDWTGIGTSIITNCVSILWDGKRYIAVGTGANNMAYSYNGTTWSVETGTSFGNNGLAWNDPSIGKSNINQHILALGTSSIFSTSKDGVRWKCVDGRNIFSIAYNAFWNGMMYVAVGEGVNSIAYSYNGVEWVGLGNSIFTKGKCVAWNGSMWVAGGEGTNTIAYSYDGIHWTGVGVSIFSVSGNAVLWTGVRWIMVGQGGNQVSYSVNGINWTPVSTAFSGGVGNGICISSDKIVSVGSGASTHVIYSIDDGLTWSSSSTTIFGSEGKDVFWNGSYYIAVGGSTVSIAESSDGISWSSVSTKFLGGYANSVYWTGKKWLVSGDNTNSSPIVYSVDGTEWYNSEATTTLFSNCYSLVGNSSISTTYIPDSLFVNKKEQIVITSPDYYDISTTSPTDISIVLNSNTK
jgi:hypothetical protein